MKRILCPKIPPPGQLIELSIDEANHLIRVLRLRDGQEIEALDGQGSSAKVALKIRGKSVWIEGLQEIQHQIQSGTGAQVLPIILEIAILKGDAMSWVIEKCVELGVQQLVPLMTAHTVVQIGKSKSNEEFQARWQKIADQSLKQCGRVSRLQIQLPIALTERLAQKSVGTRLWCDEQQWAHAPFLGDQLQSERFEGITLLIGPEGGWTDDERKVIRQSATAVSLGPLILRAETAAVFATSASHLALRRQET